MEARASTPPRHRRRRRRAIAEVGRGAGRDRFARRILPELRGPRVEPAARGPPAITGTTRDDLLDPAAATAGVVTTGADDGDKNRPDARPPRIWLHDRLLTARPARFGPTPNRGSRGGYALDEVRAAAASPLPPDTGGGRKGDDA